MFRETQGSLRCLAATILPPGAQRSVGRPGLDADEEDAVDESLWCRMFATEIPGTV